MDYSQNLSKVKFLDKLMSGSVDSYHMGFATRPFHFRKKKVFFKTTEEKLIR